MGEINPLFPDQSCFPFEAFFSFPDGKSKSILVVMESFKNTKEALHENGCFHSTILTPMLIQYDFDKTFGKCTLLRIDQLEIVTKNFL